MVISGNATSGYLWLPTTHPKAPHLEVGVCYRIFSMVGYLLSLCPGQFPSSEIINAYDDSLNGQKGLSASVSGNLEKAEIKG